MTALPRRVLHVLNGAAGGAALSTIGLIEALRAEGIESCAVCDTVGSPGERERLAHAVQGRVLFTRLYWQNRKLRSPLWRRPLMELGQLLATGWVRGSTARVARFATQWGAELIHTNTIMTPEGGLAAKRLDLAHVWHLRELIGPSNPFQLRIDGAALGRYVAAHSSKVIANSHVAAAQVRDWLPPDLLEVVPNGIDLARFRPRQLALASRALVLGMVGSLTSRSKKHSLLIEAASRVDRCLPIEWRIYGHDPSHGGQTRGDAYASGLHDLVARLGLRERFRFPGFVADPVQIMSEIDLLVHPADNESFGRVVVEAMAASLPVVGVRGGGVAEIVEHEVTGLLAEIDDAQSLAASIERLTVDAALRDRMGQAGRRRAEACYSLEACAAGVLAVYRQAMLRPLSVRNRHGISPRVATPGRSEMALGRASKQP